MNKKDLRNAFIIGAGVGLLSQPILGNFITEVHNLLPVPTGLVRPIVFAGFTLLAPIALTIAHLISKKIPVIFQFAKFAAVGTLNSFVDLGIFNFEILLLGNKPSALV